MARSDDLEREMAALRARVAHLEEEMAALRAGLPAGTAWKGASAVAQTSPVVPSAAPAPSNSAAGTEFVAEAARGRSSLESRIGSQWLNWVGIFAVLAGAAWFLKLAIDRGWIGPWPRIVVGLLASAGLYGWAQRFRRRGYRGFAHTLEAIGAGVAYLSLWTAFSVYHLIAAATALLLMTAVTAANTWLAWRENSLLLASYALAGGLATPALLWTGERHEFVLFSYLLLLDAGVAALAAARPWRRLAPAAFLATVAYYLAWRLGEFTRPEAATLGLFLALFFGLFAVIPLLASPEVNNGSWRISSEWLAIGNAVFTFAAAEDLLSATGANHGQAWIAAALAVGCGACVRVPVRGAAGRLRAIEAALALAFVTLIAPLGFSALWHGAAVALVWLAETLALVWAAVRTRESGARWAAFTLLLLTAGDVALLGWIEPLPEPITLVWNAHFGAAAALCAGFGAVAWTMHRRAPDDRLLGRSAVLALNAVALVSLSVEIHHLWACGARVGDDLCAEGAQRAGNTAARFSYSVLYMLYGAGLMAAGFWRRSAFLRWQALGLLAFAVGKVFLFDASGLSSGYRVLSFLGLGVLLLGVSFAYQKDWLALKRE